MRCHIPALPWPRARSRPQRLSVRQLEETYGVEGAAILMDRPPGGWSDLATNQTLSLHFDTLDHRFEALDHRFDALEHRLRSEFREQTTRLLLWIVPTIFAGVAALGAIVAAAT
jgi:hypothetical protein